MSKENITKGLRTWVEVDKKAVADNISAFRGLVGGSTKIMAVAKSNAYGHGLVDFSLFAQEQKADWIGVDSIVEAKALRRDGIKLPILVLGYTLPERMAEAGVEDISMTVATLQQFQNAILAGQGKQLKIHIKVDTGMHRQGFLPEDKDAIVTLIKKNRYTVALEGLYTHFASAKNPAFPDSVKEQIACFEEWKTRFEREGFKFISHAAATAGAIVFPQAHYDMVRIGVGLYGLWPSKEIRRAFREKIPLKPSLSWKTILTEIKKLPAGSKIGYDGAETLSKDGIVGICPIGYWHGSPRAMSSIGAVAVEGVECRVLGRVSMDMISVDLSGVLKAKEGDEVSILEAGNENLDAYAVASLCDTSHYEIIARINPLIKRVYR